MGHFIFAPKGLHTRLHNGARLHGEDQARVRPQKREDYGIIC